MNQIYVLHNPIQPYAWGSVSAIPELLGQPIIDGAPQAELWMGAHPKAPSMVDFNGRQVALNELLKQHALSILGASTTARFDGRLPFLFKVLAADQPLSIQAHPNRQQAQAGFNRENQQGIPLDAPHRNYKDDSHKPECICALTPFWALYGFRSVTAIQSMLDRLDLLTLAPLADIFGRLPRGRQLRQLFRDIMKMDDISKKEVTEQIVSKLDRLSTEDPVVYWMRVLADQYPGDMGILSPVLLNLICLQPGQAMYLPAGELHAYLEGVGIEIMANSDNVLRGGLTPKHVDVDELLNLLNFEERQIHVMESSKGTIGEYVYPCPAEEFLLSVITIDAHTPYRQTSPHSVEIMLCTQGSGDIINLSTQESRPIQKGVSLLIPASVEQYAVNGQAILYKATVPQ